MPQYPLFLLATLQQNEKNLIVSYTLYSFKQDLFLSILDLLYTQSFLDDQEKIYKSATKTKKHKSKFFIPSNKQNIYLSFKDHQQRSTNVGPVDYSVIRKFKY